MPNRSMTDRITVLRHLQGTYSSTQTPSTGVDVRDLHTAEVVVNVGAMTNAAASPSPSWSFALQHSDTSNADFEAVTAADVVLPDGAALGASGRIALVDSAAEDDAVYRAGYVGGKRYIRVVATAAQAPGNTPIDIVVVGELKLVA